MPAKVNADACIGCGACVDGCPAGALKLEDGKAVVDESACIDCGACVGTCGQGAIEL